MSNSKTSTPVKKVSLGGEKKEYRRWEKTITNDKVENRIEVREAENGFIITRSICTYEPSWDRDEKVYISTKNPLEGQDGAEIDGDKKIMETIDEFNKLFK